LLDEQGKQYDSKGFAAFIEQQTIHAGKHMVFIIGGAFGHHDILKKKSRSFTFIVKNDFFTSDGQTFFCRTTLQGIYHHQE
jgi:hypothetical protein